ncbi:hypothetical protein SUDANB129_05768 [Streptomyces sp. enrichment culture]
MYRQELHVTPDGEHEALSAQVAAVRKAVLGPRQLSVHAPG